MTALGSMTYPRAAGGLLAPLRRPGPWRAFAGLATVLLVVAVAAAAARLTWQLAAPADRAPVIEAAAPAVPADIPGQPRDTLQGVAALHLFGSAAAPAKERALPTEAPETRLKLTLKGVVARPEPGRGVAVIADAGGRDALYLPGAELPGAAVLEQVFEDRVILSRDGRYEMLRLPRDTARDAVAGPAAGSPAAAAQAAQRLTRLRQAWQENPASILEDLRIRPVRRDGAVHGYAITPRGGDGLFGALGLRPGDVVTGVNGTALGDAESAQQVLSQLQGAQQVTLTIERRGRPQTLQLRFGP